MRTEKMSIKDPVGGTIKQMNFFYLCINFGLRKMVWLQLRRTQLDNILNRLQWLHSTMYYDTNKYLGKITVS